MWQLKSTGEFTQIEPELVVDADTIFIDPTLPHQLQDQLEGLDSFQLVSSSRLKIGFVNHADGRGFSYAKRLSEHFGNGSNGPALVATGKLIPDQARLAFQSGFALIEIEDEEVLRHSEAAWRDALKNTVPNIYVQTNRVQSDAMNIWNARQTNM